jgi:hypothetical protein
LTQRHVNGAAASELQLKILLVTPFRKMEQSSPSIDRRASASHQTAVKLNAALGLLRPALILFRNELLRVGGDNLAAAAIGQALSMPLAERRDLHDSLFRVLSHNDIQHWADRFLAALEREPKSQLEKMPSMGS